VLSRTSGSKYSRKEQDVPDPFEITRQTLDDLYQERIEGAKRENFRQALLTFLWGLYRSNNEMPQPVKDITNKFTSGEVISYVALDLLADYGMRRNQ